MSRLVLRCLATGQLHTLTRIVGLCARRAYIIESLSAHRDEPLGVVAITLVVAADSPRVANLTDQLAKLVDVLSVEARDVGEPAPAASGQFAAECDSR